ncbi:MAG TPA: hypothetical protein VKB71_09070 [Rhizomicrobium sp.]|nr:hypothetical protein [Rhizomicrobium sp.]
MRWDTGPAIDDEIYSRLRADPRYPEAVRGFAANMLDAGDADRLLDGILKDAGRNVAALSAIHLHFSGGLTLPRLKILCASFGLVSPGRARALLLYLRYLGYVEPSGARGGAALYVPTARFLNTWRYHLRAVLRAVQVLEPAAIGLLLDKFDMPGVFETYAKVLCDVFLDGMPHANMESPYFRVFMHRNAGIQIMHTLLAASTGDAFPPQQPIALSLSAAARRFRVSRIHVRRLLDAAERDGLLRLSADGAVQFEQAGRDAIDYIFSTQLIRFLSAAARTLVLTRDLGEAAPQAAPHHAPAPVERDRDRPAHFG